jgi:hypothetical protein
MYKKADVTSSLARLTATNPVGVPSATEEDPRTQGRFGERERNKREEEKRNRHVEPEGEAEEEEEEEEENKTRETLPIFLFSSFPKLCRMEKRKRERESKEPQESFTSNVNADSSAA